MHCQSIRTESTCMSGTSTHPLQIHSYHRLVVEQQNHQSHLIYQLHHLGGRRSTVLPHLRQNCLLIQLHVYAKCESISVCMPSVRVFVCLIKYKCECESIFHCWYRMLDLWALALMWSGFLSVWYDLGYPLPALPFQSHLLCHLLNTPNIPC